MNPFGVCQAKRGKNLCNFGMYWARITVRKRFFVLFAPDVPNWCGIINNINICNQKRKEKGEINCKQTYSNDIFIY